VTYVIAYRSEGFITSYYNDNPGIWTDERRAACFGSREKAQRVINTRKLPHCTVEYINDHWND
jgi:hypothetical protein